MSLWSVRILTRFCNSSSPQVPRFRYSSSLLLRSSLLPTTRISRFHASISSSCPSVCVDSRSESTTHRENSAIYSALDSVVKVICFCSEPNVVKPWENWREGEFTGSGFVISGRRILTNAHVVEGGHTKVQVQKHGSPSKYKAFVEAAGDECDLAILAVDIEEFWEDVNPLELGDMPFIGDTVFVLGYATGGDTICVTKGIISRVVVGDYSHSSTELLTIQIDATVVPGNSGGPVIMGNKVVGVAFQGFSRDQNIEEIIPTPVVKHFLSVVEKTGYYIGSDLPDISCQAMENSHIRRHFKMKHGMSGVLINEINMVSAAHKYLKKDDVILAIDGVPIGNDEKFIFRGKERINFNHLISMKKPGERGLFKVLRDGRKHEFKIIINPVKQRLVPVFQQCNPCCYIFAGFIFVALSEQYIECSSGAICDCTSERMAKKSAEEIIIISEVLSGDINVGYSSFINLRVNKVNGVEVLNLSHLHRLIEKCRTEDLRLDLEKEKVIVLNYKSAREKSSSILKRHGVPSVMP